jgi:hypothetical protein
MAVRSIGTRRTWAAVCGAGLAALVGLQLIRPEISHPPVTADLVAPAEVKQILRNSCYDCHSNETRLAWFDDIVPAYWLVASDVKEARSHLNFSEIGKLPHAQQQGTLYEAVNQIQFGAMPLPAYTLLHRNALVTAAQLNVLKSYLTPPVALSAAQGTDLTADAAQYEQWIREGSQSPRVVAAPNGIEFPSSYKNWKAISATDRFDNQSIRVVLANDVGVKAIAENHIDPWPDGTTFAKIAWLQRDDGQGQVTAGSFVQVEFMIRDSKRYAPTLGWGWARWRGAGLTPYGKDKEFSAECVGCHTPLRSSDYVFTTPLRGQLNGSLPWNPLQWDVVTTSLDKRAATISVLYGNDAAVRYARSNSQGDYPPGAVLSLVTWAQRDDPRWFGARIPGQPESVEFLSVTAAGNQAVYNYEAYTGSPLSKTASSAGRGAGSRAAYLLSQRAAVMP